MRPASFLHLPLTRKKRLNNMRFFFLIATVGVFTACKPKEPSRVSHVPAVKRNTGWVVSRPYLLEDNLYILRLTNDTESAESPSGILLAFKDFETGDIYDYLPRTGNREYLTYTIPASCLNDLNCIKNKENTLFTLPYGDFAGLLICRCNQASETLLQGKPPARILRIVISGGPALMHSFSNWISENQLVVKLYAGGDSSEAVIDVEKSSIVKSSNLPVAYLEETTASEGLLVKRNSDNGDGLVELSKP